MEFLQAYGLFVLKSFTIVISILLTIAGIVSLRQKPKPKLEITAIHDDHEALQNMLSKQIFNEKRKKNKKKSKEPKPTLYLIQFEGDMHASQVEALRYEVSAILSIAKPQDEVLIRIESPGGSVNGYGLAAAQLQRLRDKNIPLTACIDKVAASGGYLMACVANRIIAAPFAIVGSIGVVAQLPNVHRFLKKNDIDVEVLTAGEYKRTLTVFGENTDKGRQKFKEDLELIHQNFRDYVLSHRQHINIEQVATGEHWLANDALALGLVDTLQTSDDHVIEKMQTFNVFKLKAYYKVPFITKLFQAGSHIINTLHAKP